LPIQIQVPTKEPWGHDDAMTLLPKTLITVATMVTILFTSGCASLSARDRNTITGAGVGAVAGAILTGGSSVGTVGGAAVGGYIGNQVRK